MDWEYMYSVLNVFGFGQNLIKWIKCCYARPTSRIINNNFLSREIRIERGVRQGDPLSPTLFLLCIECLAAALRNDSYIGIRLNNRESKVSLLADDTLIFVRGEPSDFDKIFRVLNKFSEMSGCTINMQKSLAFYLGSKRLSNQKPYADKGLSWPHESFRYLGIEIPINDPKQLFSLNFGNVIDKISTILNIWSSRGLTLLGRICILKTLIIPMLIYKVSVLPITLPSAFLRKLKTKMFQFVWGSKWERVKRKTLIANLEQGGANMLDVDTYIMALNLKWGSKYFDENYSAPWKHLETSVITKMELECWFRGNLPTTSKQCSQIIPLRTVRKTITDCRQLMQIMESTKPFSRSLWVSKTVALKSRTFYLKSLVNAGILDHSNLLDNAGEYLSYDKLATKFNFTPNNHEFKNFIKMIAALPPNWDRTNDDSGEKPSLVNLCNEFFETFDSPKAVYTKLKQYTTVLPEKQKQSWERDLGLASNTTHWEKLYETNYNSTMETKLRSL
uniref:Pol-like protein n=1 Tax=Phallusia mammillata TaxID=59560 RepID=A0A6F9DN32_9ASCI|nr:pol-like protein [Phallusia mammillata]